MGPLLDIVPAMVVFNFLRHCIAINPLMWSKSDFSLRFNVWYNCFNYRYLKRLVAFSHDKVGNLANLSRIDPTLLGVKYASSFTKNTLYLHGSSTPLLCFSVVLVTCDNHEQGHIFGSDPKEYVIKDIAGVLLTMELECFISVLGLAYDLLHVPDDSARKEQDLLHISMIDNAFSLFFF